MGKGPELLLLHGTGASTHSWEALAPLLASTFDVVAPDLPGHGFTSAKRAPDLSLPGMARAVGGAAERNSIAGPRSWSAIRRARRFSRGFASTARSAPRLFVSLNGAFLPFEGAAALPVSLDRQAAVSQSAGAASVRLGGRSQAVANLLRGTGSKIGRRGVDLYARLLGNPAHVAGAIGMMANGT